MQRCKGLSVVLLVAMLAMAVLPGCAAPTPEVIKETVEVPVEVTRVVEKEVEVAPKEVTLEVFNPTGAIEVTEVNAPRLDTLAGKTICELSNDLWEAERILPAIRELLKTRFPDATFVPFTEFPRGSGGIDSEDMVKVVTEKACDCVIVASAG